MGTQADRQQPSSARLHIAVLAAIVAVAKLVAASRFHHGIWIAGDGVHQAAEIAAISTQGLVVAGLDLSSNTYVYIAHALAVLLRHDSLWLVSAMQSVLFSCAVWYFAVALRRTRIAWAAVPFAYLALLDPPLTLATLSLAGGTVTSSLLLLVFGHLIRDLTMATNARTSRRILIAAGLLLTASLLTHALAPGAIALLFSWAVARGNREQAIWISAAAVALLLAVPMLLLVRNQIDNNAAMLPDSSATSGPSMSGTAAADKSRCGIRTMDVTSLGVGTLRCLANWYEESSESASRGAVSNAVAFWAPWAGPMAGRHLQNNLWAAHHPVRQLRGALDETTLLGGPVANAVSWLWLIGALASAIAGVFALRGVGGPVSALGSSAGVIVAAPWFVGMMASADPSSRLPVSALVLLLQLAGWRFMFTRGRERSRDPFAPA